VTIACLDVQTGRKRRSERNTQVTKTSPSNGIDNPRFPRVTRPTKNARLNQTQHAESKLDGCNGADFGIPEAQGSLIWASGMVVDAEEAVFTAFLELDHPAGEVRPVGTMEGLTSLLAEVHAVVRTHGPASEDPDILEAQVTTFEGGCDIFSCYDPQLAILAPIPEPTSTLLAAIGIAGWALMRRRQGNH
jgi:hypothetical protein